MKGKLEPGDWWFVCQRSGFRVRASQTKLEWNGLRVWEEVFEERQPQDFVKGIKDDQSVPFSNPGTTDRFLAVGEITPDDL